MKPTLFALFCLAGGFAPAAVIVTPGRIEVQASLEGDLFQFTQIGETLDYLTFEVGHPNCSRTWRGNPPDARHRNAGLPQKAAAMKSQL